MVKESKIGQLTPMEQMRQELKARNDEVGGILFSTVGEKDKEALMFPTYVTRQEKDRPVSEFLIVTIKAVKVIRVFNDFKIQPWMESRQEEHLWLPTPSQVYQYIAEARRGKGYQEKSRHGVEKLEFEFGDTELDFRVSRSEWHISPKVFGDSRKDGLIWNSGLVDPTRNQIEAMLAANMDRVKDSNQQTISQRVSRIIA